MYTYDHPRAANTADIVIFKRSSPGFQVALVKRLHEPYKGSFALPGGFVDQNESIKEAALRELTEEIGLTGVELHQIHTFSDPERDPRGWVITTAYGALLETKEDVQLKAGSDAAHSEWIDVFDLPPLAFDHSKIIEIGLQKFGIPIPD